MNLRQKGHLLTLTPKECIRDSTQMSRAQMSKRCTALQNTQLGEAQNRAGEVSPNFHGLEKENRQMSSEDNLQSYYY